MRYKGKALLGALISVSMVATSTAAAAAPAPQAAQPNAWMTLSMLSPTGATALGGTGVAATQADAPLPPPPPRTTEPPETTLLLIGSTLVLAALLAIALSHHGHNVSPD